MDTKIVDKSKLTTLAVALRNEQIVAFPTETVYGLGVVYDSKKAIEALKIAKHRPEDKPFTLMVASKDIIKDFACLDEIKECLINAFMPGPITFIFNKKDEVDPFITNGYSTIAIRYPDDEFVVELIRMVGKPLVVPSANISGMLPAINHQEVLEQMDGSIDYVVEGACINRMASTIIDLTGEKIKLLRQGEIRLENIKEVLHASGFSE